MCNGAPRKDACRMTRPGHRGASQLPLFIYGRAMEPFLSTRGALFFYFFFKLFYFWLYCCRVLACHDSSNNNNE